MLCSVAILEISFRVQNGIIRNRKQNKYLNTLLRVSFTFGYLRQQLTIFCRIRFIFTKIKRNKIEFIILKKSSSETCHPHCVFKLYGEVNSVKNTTINVWLNAGVY